MCYKSDEKYLDKSFEGYSKNHNKEMLCCYPVDWYCDDHKECENHEGHEEGNKKEKGCCCGQNKCGNKHDEFENDCRGNWQGGYSQNRENNYGRDNYKGNYGRVDNCYWKEEYNENGCGKNQQSCNQEQNRDCGCNRRRCCLCNVFRCFCGRK